MTVKELVEELQHYYEDKEVKILVRNNKEVNEVFIYQTEEKVYMEII